MAPARRLPGRVHDPHLLRVVQPGVPALRRPDEAVQQQAVPAGPVLPGADRRRPEPPGDHSDRGLTGRVCGDRGLTGRVCGDRGLTGRVCRGCDSAYILMWALSWATTIGLGRVPDDQADGPAAAREGAAAAPGELPLHPAGQPGPQFAGAVQRPAAAAVAPATGVAGPAGAPRAAGNRAGGARLDRGRGPGPGG